MGFKQEYLIETITKLIEAMPMSEDEIAKVVKGLVDLQIIKSSSPVSPTNFIFQQHLFGINKIIRNNNE